MKIGSALGGGLGRTGETCGAVTGSLLVIGLKYGATDTKDSISKKKTYALAKEFMTQFRERNNSLTCRELIGFDMESRTELTGSDIKIISQTCPKFLSDSCDILDKLL